MILHHKKCIQDHIKYFEDGQSNHLSLVHLDIIMIIKASLACTWVPWSKVFFRPKKFCNQHFWTKNFFRPTFFPKIFWGQNFFGTKIFFGSKLFFGPQFIRNKIFSNPKYFPTKNIFWPNIFLNQKFCWCIKNCWTKNSLGLRIFLPK